MTITFKLPLLLGTAIILSGCANTKSIHRKNPIDHRGQTELVDAKQRAIIVNPNYKDLTTTETKKNGGIITTVKRDPNSPWYRICAEPAPDVFSVYALAASGNGNFKKAPAEGSIGASAQAAFSSSETASTIERTQTINLMRESMYRTCERYMSGAIDEDTLVTQAARDQRAMVAFLAIEQLTGVVKRQPTILSSQSQATLISANKDMLEKYDRDDKEYTAKQNVVVDAKSKLDTAKGDYEKIQGGKCDSIIAQPEPEPVKPEDTQSQESEVKETETAPDGTVTEKTENKTTEPAAETLDAAEAAAELASAKLECQGAQNAISSAEQTLKSAEENRDKAKEKLDNTAELLKAVSATALSALSSGEGTGDQGSQSTTATNKVAEVVEAITLAAFSDQSEIVFTCMNILRNPKLNKNDDTRETCNKIIAAQATANIVRQSDKYLNADVIIRELIGEITDSRSEISSLPKETIEYIDSLADGTMACTLSQEKIDEIDYPELFEDGEIIPAKLMQHLEDVGSHETATEVLLIAKYCKAASDRKAS